VAHGLLLVLPMRRLRRLLLVLPLLLVPASAHAIGRVLAGKTSPPPPTVEGAQPVLFSLRHNVPIDCPVDAGVAEDLDAGIDGGTDGGIDAGACTARSADLLTVTIQPRFGGADGASDFVVLWATPSAPVVSTAPSDLFANLESLTAPEEVERHVKVEDRSLGYQCDSWGSAGGCGPDSYQPVEPLPPPPPVDPSNGVPDAGLPDAPTTIGSYEVAVLAADAPAVLAWLDQQGYVHDADDDQAVGAYLALGWTIVAARVRTDVPVGATALEPLAFTFEASEMVLPVALSRRSGGGLEAVTAYVAAEGRFEFPDASVGYAQPIEWVPGTSFLTAMSFWANLGNGTEWDPKAFRRVGDPSFRAQQIVTIEDRIPSSECPPGHGQDWDIGCGCRLTRRDRGLPGTLVLAGVAFAGALLTRRRRRL
jgi:Uncharacterized protein conserved in bacteria (DUF2330)